jgi:tetratricopeptide (TPR) repeat protein
MVLDRDREAIDILERARLLEPGSARPAARLAVLAAHRRDLARTRSYGQAALAVEPRNRHALWALAFAQELDGNLDQAEKDYRQLLELHPTEDRTLASLGHLLARLGKRAEAILIAGRLHEMRERDRRREVFEALVRTGLGDQRNALTLLELAWENKDPNLLFLHQESRFAPLAHEARFQAIEEQLRSLQ